MVLPQPWCTKDPRPCVEVVGVTETLFSVVFGVLLVTLPFVVLDHDHEIDYIKQFHHGTHVQTDIAISPDKSFYALNITDFYKYDCNQLTETIRKFLDEYLKGSVGYLVTVNRTEVIMEKDENSDVISSRILCEIHIYTKSNPRKDVVVAKDELWSVAKIAATTISKYTNETVEDILEKMTIHLPDSDQIAAQILYPGSVGNDPERRRCISELVLLNNKQDVLSMESLMYALLYCSAGTSLVAGILLTSSAYVVSRFLLMMAFLTEVASVALMAMGVIVANDPSLCMFQYGGISVYAADSPLYMQTIITYSCAAYAGSLKLYCLWFAAAYAEIAPSLKDKEDEVIFPEYDEYVAEMAKEVDQKNQELGGEEAEIHSDENDNFSDEYQEHDSKSDTSNLTGSVTSKSQKSTDTEKKATAAAKKPAGLSRSTPGKSGAKKARKDSSDSSGSDASSGGSRDSNRFVFEDRPSKGSQRQPRIRKHFGREHTIVPQKKDKNLFAQTFFGSNG